jgi:multidrug resistance efflux pump
MKSRFWFLQTILICLLLYIAPLAAGCSKANGSEESRATPSSTQAPALIETGSQDTASAIAALGTLRPAQTLQLGFRASGPVRVVLAHLGMEVEAGDLLAELDTAAMELDLQSARQEVAIRQATLNGLMNGPGAMLIARAETDHAQQVAQAEIALRMAQWRLDEAEKALERQIAQAERDLAAAQARLTLAEEANADAIAQAELDLAAAHAQLTQAEEADAGALAQAELSLAIAQEQLARLQAHEGEVTSQVLTAQISLAWAKDTLEQAEIENQKAQDRHWEPQEVRDAYARALQEARWNQDIAQAGYDQALASQEVYSHELGIQDLVVAQAEAKLAQLQRGMDPLFAIQVRQAQQKLDWLKEAVDPLLSIEVQRKQQELDWLKEGLVSAKANEGNQAQLDGTSAAFEAEVETARLELEALQAWENPFLDPAAPEEIAQASARLRQAELFVAQLELQLQGAELRAPFEGIVSAVYLRPGEWGAPGVPVVEIIDTNRWYVETRNVGELTIGRVQVGQKAQVQVLAFRDGMLHGRVEAISPVAVVQQGDTTYTLMIELDPTDLNLRPGMNVQVQILAE